VPNGEDRGRFPPEREAPRRTVFDLAETPPRTTPEAPRGMPSPEEVMRLFKEAVDRLIQVARVSPRLAPIIMRFLEEVARLRGAPPEARERAPRRVGRRPAREEIPPPAMGV